MKKIKAYKLFGVAPLVAMSLMIFAAGCGGGSSPVTTGPAAGPGNGLVQARVYLEPISGNRVAGTASDTITVTVMVEGNYSVDGSEFDVSTTGQISYSAGYGTISIFEVPIGTNHLLTAMADGYTTVKCIIGSVTENDTTSSTANEESTGIANAAIAYAAANSTSLHLMSAATMTDIGDAVRYFYTENGSYAVSTTDLSTYMTASEITISPASSTVYVAGTTQFTGTVLNSYGESISNYAWTVSGSVGTITATGLFTGSASGSGAVILTSGSVTESAEVTVLSTTSSTGCSDTAAQSVTTAKASLFKSSITQTDVDAADTALNSALSGSPSCPDANLLSAIVDLVDEGERISMEVVDSPETIFPIDGGYTVGESIARVTKPVLSNLPRKADVALGDTSAHSEYQSEIATNVLGVLSGALTKLELARTAIAADSTWSFSYPKDPVNTALGNETLDATDVDILYASLKLMVGFVYYSLAYNLDPPANYVDSDPCPEMISTWNGTSFTYTTDTTTGALTNSNTCDAADTNNDGTLTPDEYLVPSPFGTLTTNGSTYLSTFKTYVSGALALLDTSITAIIAETSSELGGVPIESTLIDDVEYYQHYLTELAASFGGTTTNMTYPQTVLCWREETYIYYYRPAAQMDTYYIYDEVEDPTYNTADVADCIQQDVHTAAFTAPINFGALATVTDFRNVLPDYDLDNNITSDYINDTVGGLFPSGLQSSWFDFESPNFSLYVYGSVIDSTTESAISLSGLTATLTVDGKTLTCDTSYNLNCYQYVSDTLPTSSDYMTINEMFGTNITLSVSGYQDKIIKVFESWYNVGTLELTPSGG